MRYVPLPIAHSMSGVALSSGVPPPEEARVVLESQDFRKPAGVLLHFSRVSLFDDEQLSLWDGC